MRLEHKGLGLSVELLDEVRQRHVETFFAHMRHLAGSSDKMLEISIPENSGNAIRAAIRAGILLDVEEDDIDEWKPAATFWLAPRIDKIIQAVLTIPPE